MATWQTPPSFQTGESPLPAAKLNTISNDLAYLKERLDALSGGSGGQATEMKTSGATGPVSATLGGVYALGGYMTWGGAASGFGRYSGPYWNATAAAFGVGNAVAASFGAVARLAPGSSVSGQSGGTLGSPAGGLLSMARIGP